jgi:hypothetical protein
MAWKGLKPNFWKKTKVKTTQTAPKKVLNSMPTISAEPMIFLSKNPKGLKMRMNKG